MLGLLLACEAEVVEEARPGASAPSATPARSTARATRPESPRRPVVDGKRETAPDPEMGSDSLYEEIEKALESGELTLEEVAGLREALEPDLPDAPLDPSDDEPADDEPPSITFEPARLIERGLTPGEVDYRQDQWLELSTEWQSLRERAAEQQWLDTPSYREERSDITEQFTQQHGEEALSDLQEATDGWLVVAQVRPRGTGAQAGIQPGDKLRSYGETSIFGIDDFQGAIEDAQGGDPIPVRLDRNGEEITLFVSPGELGLLISGQAP